MPKTMSPHAACAYSWIKPRRALPIQRSAIAFARGACTGVLVIRTPMAVGDPSRRAQAGLHCENHLAIVLRYEFRLWLGFRWRQRARVRPGFRRRNRRLWLGWRSRWRDWVRWGRNRRRRNRRLHQFRPPGHA